MHTAPSRLTPPRFLSTMDVNRETLEDIVLGRTQATPKTTTVENAIEQLMEPWSPPFRLLQFYQSRGQLPDESEMKISEMAAEDVQEHEKKEAADLLECIRRRHKLWRL